MAKTYYTRNNNISDTYRLSPAPQVSIKTEPYYSGDAIIGYTYNISLRGYASTYRKTSNSQDPKFSEISISKVADSINFIKTTLTRNGSDLIITEDNGSTVLKAKGGTLRNLTFGESPNNWSGYAEYNAEIEFNEIELITGTALSTIQCSGSYLDGLSLSSSIVDISKYKLKTFTDSWSFNIDELIYNRVKNTEVGNIDTDNSRMSVSYTISATGKNFYINGNLIPAWEQAKNFVQDRLYKQITTMLSSAMGITVDTACAATASLNNLGQATDGLYKSLEGSYQVYNETISCQASESDGTFSATYNALIKRYNSTATNFPASIHTFNKTVTKQTDSRNNTNISIQGNIEGLIPGGVILTSSSGFRIPQNGSIIVSTTGIVNKYTNAANALALITNGNDLSSNVKNILGINASALGISGSCLSSNIRPASFNLTHNYHEGTISYSVEYNSIIACGRSNGSYSNISISTEYPTKVLAEIPIPQSNVSLTDMSTYAVLIQDLNTVTAQKVNITIEGRTARDCCLSASGLINKIINSSNAGVPDGIILPNMSNYILTSRQRNDNPIDGSYIINLSYICTIGCGI